MKNATPLLDIKTGPIFPLPFRFMAVLCILAPLALLPSHPLVAIILLLAGAAIITAQEGIEFNQSNNTYREYNAFLFIKFGTFHPYQGVEKVFINSGQVSQRAYTAHTATSAVFTNHEYRGYVKLDNGTKLLLANSKKKSSIEEKVQKVSNYLNTDIVDISA